MLKDGSLDSFRSSLDANYDWPALYPFKFIVPKEQTDTVLELFADDPVRENPSSTGRFVAYTMEMNMHSSDEVIAIYQRVAQVPGVISL
jgi:putative lipoic acid-binding regulatory protein